jgi:hypothetical protein
MEPLLQVTFPGDPILFSGRRSRFSVLHSLPGSDPAANMEQEPTWPARLHAWQVPLQALLQHTPSTQNEDWQYHYCSRMRRPVKVCFGRILR